MRGAIETERELEDMLHKAARSILGPEASEDDVHAYAHKAYNGPPAQPIEDTEHTEREWREKNERERALIRKWGLPKY